MKLFYWRAILLGAVSTSILAYLTTWASNRQDMGLTNTQFSIIGMLAMFVFLLVINPLLRLIRRKALNHRELFIIFIMMIVPAGLPTFGYLGTAIPLAGGLHNPLWNTPQSGYDENLVPHMDQSLYVKDKEALRDYAFGLRAKGGEAYPVFIAKDDQTWGEYFSNLRTYTTSSEFRAKRSFWGDVPWGAWLPSLFQWFFMGLTFFVLFYALNELLFKQWFENEKLVFPIGELFRSVFGSTEEESSGSAVPLIYKTPLFWVGFGIAFLICFYNGMVNARWLEGLSQIDLMGNMSPHFKDSVLQSILPFYAEIFFVVIGLAFLLPKDISFSMWFFYLVMKLQKFIAVSMGHTNFSANWLTESNFIYSQGGGAMELFGLICLWKVRHNMLAFILRFARPEGTKKMTAEEIKKYTWPSLIFFVTSVLFVYFFMRGGMPLSMSVFTFLFLLFMVVTTVRLTAECGVISFTNWFGPMHMLKAFGLFKFTALFPSTGVAHLVTIISVMYWDLKTFIAPTMINARFLAEKERIPKRTFVFSMFLGIILTMVVCVFLQLILVYDQGVSSMNGWFFQAFPRSTLQVIFQNMQKAESLKTMEANSFWMISGGAICGGLMYLRQYLFWMPHPIGLIFFATRITHHYWFAYFIAWLCKSFAIKYCSPNAYKLVRAFFIGLILGQLIAIGAAIVFGLAGFENMGISLNRS